LQSIKILEACHNDGEERQDQEDDQSDDQRGRLLLPDVEQDLVRVAGVVNRDVRLQDDQVGVTMVIS